MKKNNKIMIHNSRSWMKSYLNVCWVNVTMYIVHKNKIYNSLNRVLPGLKGAPWPHDLYHKIWDNLFLEFALPNSSKSAENGTLSLKLPIFGQISMTWGEKILKQSWLQIFQHKSWGTFYVKKQPGAWLWNLSYCTCILGPVIVAPFTFLTFLSHFLMLMRSSGCSISTIITL